LLKKTAATIDPLDGLVSDHVWLVDQKVLIRHHLSSIAGLACTGYIAMGVQGHGGLVLQQGLLDQ